MCLSRYKLLSGGGTSLPSRIGSIVLLSSKVPNHKKQAIRLVARFRSCTTKPLELSRHADTTIMAVYCIEDALCWQAAWGNGVLPGAAAAAR
jgi:hypothetical protein